MRRICLACFLGCFVIGQKGFAQTEPAAKPAVLVAEETKPVEKKPDEKGKPVRTAKVTGHVSNYDEAKISAYTLPDPLKMNSGAVVQDAASWRDKRRPEILELYRHEIYGRVPPTAPQVVWKTESDEDETDGQGKVQKINGHVGGANQEQILHLIVHKPSGDASRRPLLVCLNFAFLPPRPTSDRPRTEFADPVAMGRERGWVVATLNYTDIQADKKDMQSTGVIGQALTNGKTAPADDEWGSISAWAWGLSRAIDHLQTLDFIDGQKIAIQGHSRLGKTVLWCAAQDERVQAVFSSCSGEMGASLARRDFGETVDDMAQNFPWQFCGNFQKYIGHWNEMPVDSHLLISLVAPRLVFVSGGSLDQWADPPGEFLAMVAAGPVYRLLGCEDFGAAPMPELDQPLVTRQMGFSYHTGGHYATAGEWNAFLQMAEKRFAAK